MREKRSAQGPRERAHAVDVRCVRAMLAVLAAAVPWPGCGARATHAGSAASSGAAQVEPSAQEPVQEPRASAAVTDAGAARDLSSDPRFAPLLEMADETVSRVSTLRGLAVREPVARGVLSREEILVRMRARVAQEYPAGEVALEAEVPRRLGLIPEGLDYEATILSLLEEQVAGFYDPSERRLFIASWTPRSEQGVTLSHEITHALQDQHFSIGRYVHHVRGQGDAQSAAMAVVEGDATLTMLEDMLAQQGMSLRTVGELGPMIRRLTSVASLGAGSTRLRAAPRAIREGMLFPYQEGFAMCARAYQRGGFAAIDELLRSPPASTEQVLHPEKLRAREAPRVLSEALPAALAATHEAVYQDVLGELSVRQVLETQHDDDAAVRGAAGWGGDRVLLAVPREDVHAGAQATARLDRATLVWSLLFDPVEVASSGGVAERDRARRVGAAGAAATVDRDAEAREFEGLAAQTMARRHTGAQSLRVAPATVAFEVAPGLVSLVARAGTAVVWLERVPQSVATRTACEALANARAVAAERGALPRGC